MRILLPLALAIALPLNAQVCDEQRDASGVADPLAPKLLKLDPDILRTIRYMGVSSNHIAMWVSVPITG
jgi:hypothetical protein